MKEELIKKIKITQKEINNILQKRLKEFKEKSSKSKEEIFEELCFCILTANFNAEKSIKIQNHIKTGFITLTEEKLRTELKKLGHRFPNTRASYIVEARKYISKIYQLIKTEKERSKIRDWLVKNIKGLGYKEASHFLRNIGFEDIAIIDFHILDLLEKYNITKKPKILSKKKYLEIENILFKISKETKTHLAELDLILWYIETKKVLK